MVTRFTKVGGGVTAHSHVRLQFRYLGNRSALTLKPHQKQTYLFRAHFTSLVNYTMMMTTLVNSQKGSDMRVRVSTYFDTADSKSGNRLALSDPVLIGAITITPLWRGYSFQNWGCSYNHHSIQSFARGYHDEFP